jgi:hypothetical protein
MTLSFVSELFKTWNVIVIVNLYMDFFLYEYGCEIHITDSILFVKIHEKSTNEIFFKKYFVKL